MTENVGGFFTRLMPPIDYDCGPIPEACYNKNLGRYDICKLLEEVYLEPERIKKLAGSDDPISISTAKNQLYILAEIDAGTIWGYNLSVEK